MFMFQTIGSIFRLIFIYRFDIKKMNLAHKVGGEQEVAKEIKVGGIFFLILVLAAIVFGYYS